MVHLSVVAKWIHHGIVRTEAVVRIGVIIYGNENLKDPAAKCMVLQYLEDRAASSIWSFHNNQK